MLKYPFVTIDPGINIGLALFDQNNKEPFYTKVIQSNQGTWEVKSKAILLAFEYEIRKISSWKVEQAYIEKPAFQEQGKGLVAAREGSFFKLVCVYGGMLWIMEKYFNIHEMEVNWKGQMDKAKVNMRIEKSIGNKYQDHIADAVGMGLFLKGIL